jgi:hypothetical protein
MMRSLVVDEELQPSKVQRHFSVDGATFRVYVCRALQLSSDCPSCLTERY